VGSLAADQKLRFWAIRITPFWLYTLHGTLLDFLYNKLGMRHFCYETQAAEADDLSYKRFLCSARMVFVVLGFRCEFPLLDALDLHTIHANKCG
jgi:hypothetical protein